MRRVARRAAKLPVRGSVRGSVCVGNSSGPPSVPICAAAPPPPEARSTCCGYTVVVGTAGPGSSRPALGRPWRKIRSRRLPPGLTHRARPTAAGSRVHVCVPVTPPLFDSHQTTGSATNLTNIPIPSSQMWRAVSLCVINVDFFFKIRFSLKS